MYINDTGQIYKDDFTFTKEISVEKGIKILEKENK